MGPREGDHDTSPLKRAGRLFFKACVMLSMLLFSDCILAVSLTFLHCLLYVTGDLDIVRNVGRELLIHFVSQ